MDPKKALQVEKLSRSQAMLRAAYRDFISVIEEKVEHDIDRYEALARAREAFMWANTSLANEIRKVSR